MDYIVQKQDSIIVIEERKKQVKNSIVEQFISIRKAKHLTQEDIARRTGIARSNIARIESGKYVPTIEVLTKLAIALDMNLEIQFTEK
ncbi:MAG: helix-turn-helix transcriptional regulator [Lachnospiraceae bacterium]|nr:helix-turn-helix transcriptional regulator [Lachnospiraceae bacterium]